MTLPDQFFEYKNGLEVTITFASACQAIYLFSKRGEKNVAVLHGSIFLILAVNFLLLTLENTFEVNGSQILFSIIFVSYGPLSYFMTRILIDRQQAFSKAQILLVFFIGLAVAFLSNTYFNTLGLEKYLWNVGFFLFSIYKTRKYSNSLFDGQHVWLLQYLGGFALIFLTYPVVYVTYLFVPEAFLSFKIPFTIFFLLFVVNNFRHIVFKPHVLSFNRKSSQSTLGHDQLSQVAFQIRNKMATDKPFLQTQFDLKMLSSKLGYSERLISEVINKAFKQNFNQFANSYRLEAAIAIMKKDTDQAKLLKEIMYESGFSNKASFNNAFKTNFQTNPSTFRKGLEHDAARAGSTKRQSNSQILSNA